MVGRGLPGMRLMIFDTHRGLAGASGAALLGTPWQTVPHPLRAQLLTTVLRAGTAAGGHAVAHYLRSVHQRPGAGPARLGGAVLAQQTGE
ncbi:hypothetical protein ACFWYW_36310 [Nonomuraea sp. NPDC059023]|uniref:hypothetical protein n=1 Tax=unclassified Nonomuraea TaxID=2593643 RepID=UPI0036A689D3